MNAPKARRRVRFFDIPLRVSFRGDKLEGKKNEERSHLLNSV
jgi:hypothetical protein